MSDFEKAKALFFEALNFIDMSDFHGAETRLRAALALAPKSPSILTNLSVVLLRQNKLDEARDHAERALVADVNDVEALLVLAHCRAKSDELVEALSAYDKVISLDPNIAEAHNNRGLILKNFGRVEDALDSYDRVAAIEPQRIEGHVNRGNLLCDLKRNAEAIAAYDKALALEAGSVEAWLGRGRALAELGRHGEAIAAYDRAVALDPRDPAGHVNLGNVHKSLGRLDDAEARYRRALGLQPDLAEAHNNLGLVFKDRGNLIEAEACYRQALRSKPSFADAAVNLGNVLLDRGEVVPALEVAQLALAVREAKDSKALFARCLGRAVQASTSNVEVLRNNVLRALTEPWGRPSDLAGSAASMLKQDPAIAGCIKRANDAWPRRLPGAELLGPAGLAAFGAHALLMGLLESTPVCDIELECFLTALRFVLLERATAAPDPAAIEESALKLGCALAQQCFVNEYVFAHADGEFEQASRLREALIAALQTGRAVPALWLAAVAAYEPLGALPSAEKILDRSWPEALDALLVQQVREPIADREARASIPRLTPIVDDVSRLVQEQYEENPYPRWVRTASMDEPMGVEAYLRRQLPLARIRDFSQAGGPEILVAGCGTGQHAIEMAQRFAGANFLAIDLSLTSLCYAQRKSRALGLNHLHYAQADILQLGSIGRTFDLIEAAGVLHHLADPLAGWRVLVAILRTGGVMRVGLYSKLARGTLGAVQAFISARGYGQSADDIRRFRQDLLRAGPELASKIAFESRDFFSTSECRDLLFHRQEHRFTLPEINSFLAGCGLEFLGFDIEGQLLRQFRMRFPDPKALTDLALWNVFETESPRTFGGMYQFYVRKV